MNDGLFLMFGYADYIVLMLLLCFVLLIWLCDFVVVVVLFGLCYSSLRFSVIVVVRLLRVLLVLWFGV